MTEQRTHLAVPLTPSEAALLAREGSHPCNYSCCGHLDSFHNTESTSNGGRWRSCAIFGCGCCEETGPSFSYLDTIEADRHAVRDAKFAALIGGMLFGSGLGFLVGIVVEYFV